MSATRAIPANRLDRRLLVALVVVFILLASLLVGLGLWLERPWGQGGIVAEGVSMSKMTTVAETLTFKETSQ